MFVYGIIWLFLLLIRRALNIEINPLFGRCNPQSCVFIERLRWINVRIVMQLHRRIWLHCWDFDDVGCLWHQIREVIDSKHSRIWRESLECMVWLTKLSKQKHHMTVPHRWRKHRVKSYTMHRVYAKFIGAGEQWAYSIDKHSSAAHFHVSSHLIHFDVYECVCSRECILSLLYGNCIHEHQTSVFFMCKLHMILTKIDSNRTELSQLFPRKWSAVSS